MKLFCKETRVAFFILLHLKCRLCFMRERHAASRQFIPIRSSRRLRTDLIPSVDHCRILPFSPVSPSLCLLAIS
jgi:hypothetical protein